MTCSILYTEPATRWKTPPGILSCRSELVSCMIGCRENLSVADEEPQPNKHLLSAVQQSGATCSSSRTRCTDLHHFSLTMTTKGQEAHSALTLAGLWSWYPHGRRGSHARSRKLHKNLYRHASTELNTVDSPDRLTLTTKIPGNGNPHRSTVKFWSPCSWAIGGMVCQAVQLIDWQWRSITSSQVR